MEVIILNESCQHRCCLEYFQSRVERASQNRQI